MIKINVKSCILKKNFDSYEYCFRIIKKTYLDKKNNNCDLAPKKLIKLVRPLGLIIYLVFRTAAENNRKQKIYLTSTMIIAKVVLKIILRSYDLILSGTY